MAMNAPPIGDPAASLGGRLWQWRGGNMDLADASGFTLEDDLVTQLLLSRGVARDDLARLEGLCGKTCPEARALSDAITRGPAPKVVAAEAVKPQPVTQTN